ncbi:large conductance mechanosensitive channel protein MscL [Sulfurospirillum diekertiae]|uniref:Large-conductance mechanosensitive channel n=1 Tax=Sulfurospirillum diekertiae TaxID=1854492 RepID=A0A290HAN2_9BACT|nr:large conductance mechanosensitive channel protein MscL [Sulfurospirillum diekertiae]ATB68612.1 large-conductance mechanosensitive channel [Sulfurospirillum diekertiae]QIR76448.1 large conductance mechanosensitive channel protein MscL [Sulfurospirillum diekertiae]QIR79076.1 large conductance mechanosensitive channel protein MscL [Sulfurospirillum diekertiae]
MLKEFRDFLLKGNVVDMAVGFIFGAAFATIVKSLVTNVIMPPIGLLLGNVDFSSLFIALDGKTYASLADLEKAGAPAIKLGVFFNDLTSFVILGFVMFMMIKGYGKIAPKKAPEAITKACPECAMAIPVAAKKCPYCATLQA